MLYIVLALVLSAFGLLIAALTTANTLWAWMSVVVSVVAAALLVMDWVNGRRRKGTGESGRPKVTTVGGQRRRRGEPDVGDDRLDDDLSADEGDLLAGEDPFSLEPEPRADLDFEPEFVPVADTAPRGAPDAVRTVVTEAVEPPPAGGSAHHAEDLVEDSADYVSEPDEEPTDASDLLVVAGLNAEVRVVDEHPRYHLATCVWLANRPTIPIPISEARQLGFTPCSRCAPDSVLAARHRAAR